MEQPNDLELEGWLLELPWGLPRFCHAIASTTAGVMHIDGKIFGGVGGIAWLCMVVSNLYGMWACTPRTGFKGWNAQHIGK